MADPSTFIKIDRNILKWQWFRNETTFHVFMYLLLSANIKDSQFEGRTIHRGQIATSYQSIGLCCGISVQQARTAISHLKKTGEITASQQARYQVITIVSYDKYQSYQQAQPTQKYQVNRQSTGSDNSTLLESNMQDNSLEIANKSRQQNSFSNTNPQNQQAQQHPFNSLLTGSASPFQQQSKNIRNKEDKKDIEEEEESDNEETEMIRIQQEQNDLFDAAQRAGFGKTTAELEILTDFYSVYGLSACLEAIESCTENNAKAPLKYMKAILSNPTPKPKTTAADKTKRIVDFRDY